MPAVTEVKVLLISAELDEIFELSDRIAVMYEGQITTCAGPANTEQELGLLMTGRGTGGSMDLSDDTSGKLSKKSIERLARPGFSRFIAQRSQSFWRC